MTLALRQELANHNRRAVKLIRLVLPTAEVLRFNTGFRHIDWDDGTGDGEQTWFGWGVVLSLELPEVSSALEVSEFTLTVSGISTDYRWLAGEDVRGNPIRIWQAFTGEDGRVRVAEEVENGLQDRVQWSENDDGTQAVSLVCLGGVAFLQSQHRARWSPEPHADWLASIGEDPDSDTGFDRQAGIPEDAKGAAWWPPT